jgi:hypothetical protein
MIVAVQCEGHKRSSSSQMMLPLSIVPLQTWRLVCRHSLCCPRALRLGDLLSKESYQLRIGLCIYLFNYNWVLALWQYYDNRIQQTSNTHYTN